MPDNLIIALRGAAEASAAEFPWLQPQDTTAWKAADFIGQQQAKIAGLEASCEHLGRLVDELRHENQHLLAATGRRNAP